MNELIKLIKELQELNNKLAESNRIALEAKEKLYSIDFELIINKLDE